MKKIILVVTLISLFGCSPKVFTIGMNENDFLRHNRAAIQVEANSERTVYKKVDYGFGHPASVKFFYFKNGLLYNIDTGIRNPDIIVQHNN